MPTNIFTSDVPERSAVDTLVALYNKLYADLVALRTAYEAHIHTGVTTGAGDSAIRKAGTAGVAPAVTSDTIVLKK